MKGRYTSHHRPYSGIGLAEVPRSGPLTYFVKFHGEITSGSVLVFPQLPDHKSSNNSLFARMCSFEIVYHLSGGKSITFYRRHAAVCQRHSTIYTFTVPHVPLHARSLLAGVEGRIRKSRLTFRRLKVGCRSN